MRDETLVERLRRKIEFSKGFSDKGPVSYKRLVNPDGPEAANRITSLEERERVLRSTLERCKSIALREDMNLAGRVACITSILHTALSAGVTPCGAQEAKPSGENLTEEKK